MITAAGEVEGAPVADEDHLLEEIDPVVAVPQDGTLANDIRKVIARRAANMVESYLSGTERAYWPSQNPPVQYGTPVQYGKQFS
ncbi:hypothetical protein GNI_081830 [Gregarina niphandrodes]|uniref:Uncharacterized protein n=1 Tax=Gregarina niphandrodes TaxID=110365 RepID=A0A023B693_GRENI|nr:hypothetical protein GNI_081830 [Gregarina niphandrodes]EZG65882.1 hypothetical protein GNI_081830 [Gregarina niphandrodes]|eukprot:XP_011134040.1 hypothetical protein GNI_081830 [Gregarina niphandrodes]